MQQTARPCPGPGGKQAAALPGVKHRPALLDADPNLNAQFRRIALAAERHFGSACMFDFVVQEGVLFVTDCRSARTTGPAAIKIALDLFTENVITGSQVLAKITPLDLWAAVLPRIDPASRLELIGEGVPAFAGVVSGSAVFTAAGAHEMARQSRPFIFVRTEISPDDLPAVIAAKALLTLRGGISSHGALVCRQLGKVAVVGLGGNVTDDRTAIVGLSRPIRANDLITLNGATGEVFLGEAVLDAGDWRDNPYLQLLQTLLDVLARTDALPADHIGSCWRLRDILLRGSAPSEPEDPRAQLRTWPRPKPGHREGVTFRHVPAAVAIRLFVEGRAFALDETSADARLIWLGLRQHLFGLLARFVGLGRHPDFYRPLFDPTEVITAARGFIPHYAEEGRCQMIGEEFFGINHWVDDYLAFDSIQLFAVVRCERPEGLSRIDRTNPEGEKLLVGSRTLVSLRVVVNGAVVPGDELARFYHYFRMQEHRVNQSEATPWELRQFLRDCHQGAEKPNHRHAAVARQIGLLDTRGQLTGPGRSAMEKTHAKARRAQPLP